MKRVTREFVKMAYTAMQSAYYTEADKTNGVEAVGDYDFRADNETLKKIGEVLQAVGDLSRML